MISRIFEWYVELRATPPSSSRDHGGLFIRTETIKSCFRRKDLEHKATRPSWSGVYGGLTPSHADLSRKLLSAWLGCANCVTSRLGWGTQAAWADCVTLSAGQAGWHHECNIFGVAWVNHRLLSPKARTACAPVGASTQLAHAAQAGSAWTACLDTLRRQAWPGLRSTSSN